MVSNHFKVISLKRSKLNVFVVCIKQGIRKMGTFIFQALTIRSLVKREKGDSSAACSDEPKYMY